MSRYDMTSLPNIVLFMTDQQRADTIGAYGSAVCQTPNIDRLATEGLHFTNAFTPCALCSPARASLLNGTFPHEHGVLTNVRFTRFEKVFLRNKIF